MLGSSKPDFADALRQADCAYSNSTIPEEVSNRLDARLRNKAETAGPPRRLTRGLAVAMATCVVTLVLVLLPSASPTLPTTSGFALINRSEDFAFTQTQDGTLTITSGQCQVIDPDLGLVVTNAGSIALKKQGNGVRIVRGTARFAVKKRKPNEPPAAIWVSHGRIEVLGTEFTVQQEHRGGDVKLHEGSIRFVGKNGQTHTLRAGQTLSWPLTPIVPDAPSASFQLDVPIATKDAGPPPPSLRKNRAVRAPIPNVTKAQEEQEARERLFFDLARFRSRGEYVQALDLLRQALESETLSTRTREQLSFELGTILTDQLRDVGAACAHWTRHITHYPTGRYSTEVQSAQGRLDCKGRQQ